MGGGAVVVGPAERSVPRRGVLLVLIVLGACFAQSLVYLRPSGQLPRVDIAVGAARAEALEAGSFLA